MSEGVVAVVAAYRPQDDLVDNVAAALSQVQGVVVVDDGSPEGTEHILDALGAAGAMVLRREVNSGIAAALNAGIEEALARWHPEFVLTLDQDSCVTDGYVEHAVQTYRRATQAGVRVGLVTASSYGDAPTPTRRSPDDFPRAFDPMQSGTVIPVTTIDAIGLLDEGLFIDGVDSDYTARAHAAGLAVLVGQGCRLEHGLGRRERTTIFGRPVTLLGRELSYNYHSPSRVYYIARNGAVLTVRHLRHDTGWVARRLIEETKAHGMRVVLGRDRGKMVRAMVAGYLDAARGRAGRIPERLAERLR